MRKKPRDFQAAIQNGAIILILWNNLCLHDAPFLACFWDMIKSKLTQEESKNFLRAKYFGISNGNLTIMH
jgi:hypothetical protein